MNIEKDLFERSIIDTNKLLEYGFIKEEDILVYKKKILDDSFLVVIEYRDYIKGKIIDLDFLVYWWYDILGEKAMAIERVREYFKKWNIGLID